MSVIGMHQTSMLAAFLRVGRILGSWKGYAVVAPDNRMSIIVNRLMIRDRSMVVVINNNHNQEKKCHFGCGGSTRVPMSSPNSELSVRARVTL